VSTWILASRHSTSLPSNQIQPSRSAIDMVLSLYALIGADDDFRASIVSNLYRIP